MTGNRTIRVSCVNCEHSNTKVRLLRVALADLLMVIAVDELIPESVSYMQLARETLEKTK